MSVAIYLLRTGIWDSATLSLYLFEDLEHFIVKKGERERISPKGCCVLGGSQEKVTDHVGRSEKICRRYYSR